MPSAPSTETKWSTRLWTCIAIGLTAICLMGCSSKSMPPLRASLPPLPAQAAQPCTLPQPLSDGQISTLISALMDAWEAQAQCERKRVAVVDAYEKARATNNGK